MSVRPRRVLHVLNAAGGGAALSTLALVEAFAAEGIESTAVCDELGTVGERQRLAEAVQGRVLFTRLNWWNRKLTLPLWKRPLSAFRQGLVTGWTRRSAGRVAEFAALHRAELIHTNTILTPEGGLAARRLGLPHVWHLRELVGPGHPFRLPYEGPALGRYLRQRCSLLVANSQVAAAQVRDWLPTDLLEVVCNGIDLSPFDRVARRESGSEIVVAMVGSLTSRVKNHALFVEAAARVDRALPIRWRIYGHDPSQGGRVHGNAHVHRLHDLIAQRGLTSRFDWPGFVADPAEIMSQLDILVHPCAHESFGRVAVEAMAACRPVVGARGGGVAEIVADGVTGLLVRPEDAADLAASIERLARDPALRQAMGDAGRRRAESQFSLSAYCRGVLRVYEQAMLRPLGRPAPIAQSETAQGAAPR